MTDPSLTVRATKPEPRMPLTYEQKVAEAYAIYGEDGPSVLRDVPALFELEILHGVHPPHESLKEIYESGCAEPWTTQLVTSLLIASNQRNVVEIGGFTGQTSAWLACALERVGGGTLTVVEIDPDRCRQVEARCNGLGLKCTAVNIVPFDSLRYIPTIPDKSIGFVWVDGCHEKFHVEQEINALWTKVRVGGIMSFHDVWGSCDLQTVIKKYGGISINLPRLGKAGGVGLIQMR